MEESGSFGNSSHFSSWLEFDDMKVAINATSSKWINVNSGLPNASLLQCTHDKNIPNIKYTSPIQLVDINHENFKFTKNTHPIKIIMGGEYNNGSNLKNTMSGKLQWFQLLVTKLKCDKTNTIILLRNSNFKDLVESAEFSSFTSDNRYTLNNLLDSSKYYGNKDFMIFLKEIDEMDEECILDGFKSHINFIRDNDGIELCKTYMGFSGIKDETTLSHNFH